MINLKILSITKQIYVETEQPFLDVEFNIIETSENDETPPNILAERRLAFSLNTPQKDIKTALEKYLANFIAEKDMAADRVEIDKANKNADDVISNLEGLEL